MPTLGQLTCTLANAQVQPCENFAEWSVHSPAPSLAVAELRPANSVGCEVEVTLDIPRISAAQLFEMEEQHHSLDSFIVWVSLDGRPVIDVVRHCSMNRGDAQPNRCHIRNSKLRLGECFSPSAALSF